MADYDEWRSYPPVPENYIDVVLPWLNPTPDWLKQYELYKEDEDPARIRDLKTIRPTLNGIIKNMKFVRYIWLIVFDEKQVQEDWPELKHTKVKIVYHRDILPKEFLPNFNSLLPAMYMWKIPGLADQFIFMNDDMVVTKPLSRDMYFDGDKTVHQKSIKPCAPVKSDGINLWNDIIENTHRYFRMLTGGQDYSISNYHMPVPLNKKMCIFLYKKFEKDFYESCLDAKIRKPKSISLPELAYWCEEFLANVTFKNIYTAVKTKFLVLNDNTTRENIETAITNNHIVCINDSEDLKNKSEYIAKTIEEMMINM